MSDSVLLPRVYEQLCAIVGEPYVLTGKADVQCYGIDRTTCWQPSPLAIVLPDSTEQVQALVQLANREQLAVVPSGGRTGLSGGAVACCGELVIALDRMNQVLGFSATDHTVSVQAGVITADLQHVAEQQGLYYPVDFASAGSSQVGGNIATNAGGINVVRYGSTRQWVLGLTVVTGAGEVLALNQGLVKNNTGYDFRHLFIGSEGTLGIICEATLQLTRPPQNPAVMLLAVPAFPAVMDILPAAATALKLTAFECFSANSLDYVEASSGLKRPFNEYADFYVLLEYEQTGGQTDDAPLNLFEHCLKQGWASNGVISQSVQQAKNLWRYREDISSSLHRHQPFKSDISVKVSQLAEFLAAAQRLIASEFSQLEPVWYGHAGDGNLHLNIPRPQSLPVEQFTQLTQQLNERLAGLIHDFQGSVSAEHGIGLLKKSVLGATRSPADIALMRQVKAAFDPNGIMNPGKIFD